MGGLAFEQGPGHPSRWATVVSVAGEAGMTPQTLHNWVRPHERDAGQRVDLTREEAGRIQELRNLLQKMDSP